MSPAELVAAFRSEMQDIVQPYLWPDDEIVAYLDDAQIQFCTLIGGLRDAVSALCTLVVPAGAKSVAYDPRILMLRDAYRESDGRRVTIMNMESMMGPARMTDTPTNLGLSWQANQAVGPIRAVITGMSQNALHIVGNTDAEDTLHLVLNRLPLDTVTLTSALEIPPQNHRTLLLWMKHLALLKQDAEVFDKARAEECAREFYAKCGEAKQSMAEREHVYRTVAYGGL